MEKLLKFISNLVIIFLLSASINAIFTYALSCSFSIKLTHIQYLFFISIGISTYLNNKFKLSDLIETDINSIIAFLIVSAPLFFFFTQNTNFNTAPHFEYHYAYVQEIIDGNIPPNNVYGYGLKSSTYWSYHVLLALFSRLTTLPVEYAYQIINSFGLLAITIFCNSIIQTIAPNLKHKVLWILFIAFSMNIMGGVIYLMKFIIHGEDLFDSRLYINLDYLAVSYNIPIQYKDILHKFYSFSATSIGFAFFLLNILLILKIRNLHYKFGQLSILALSCGILFHPTLTIISAIGCMIYFIEKWKDNKLASQFWIDLCICVLIGLGYLFFLTSGMASFGNDNVTLNLYNYTSIISFLHTVLPSIIICTVAVFFSKQLNLNSFILILTSIAILLSIFVSIKVHNQYKLSYEAVVLLSILTVSAISNIRTNNLKKLLILIIAILMILKISIVALHFIKNYTTPKENYYSENRLINSPDSDEQQMIEWLRNKNEGKKVLLIIPDGSNITSFSSCAHAKLYVRNYWIFTDGPDFMQRFENRDILYNSNNERERLNTFSSIVNEFPGMEVLLYANDEANFEINDKIFNQSGNFKHGKFYQLK